MNNKGFTIVELLASFTLTMIIVVFLFEIVLDLKDVYVNNSLRVKIMEKNAVLATTLNDKLSSSSFTILGEGETADNLCTIRYNDGTSEKTYGIKIENNKIILNNEQTISMPENTEIAGSCLVEYRYNNDGDTKDNAFFKLSYSVSNDELDKNMTFNYIYSYHHDLPLVPENLAAATS